MPEPYVPDSTGCPACYGRAELEEEDGLRKFVCPCGFEFGYNRLDADEEACSLGIPEPTRQAMARIEAEAAPGPLLIVTGDSIPVGRPE